jgi:hypothetical protein
LYASRGDVNEYRDERLESVPIRRSNEQGNGGIQAHDYGGAAEVVAARSSISRLDAGKQC